MKYREEDYARDLHQDLVRRFADSSLPTQFDIVEAGVGRFSARRGPNLCSISCFHNAGPEYWTSFARDSEEVAGGRTSSKHDTVDAIDDWLQGRQLSELYDRFGFVDQRKLALAGIRDDMFARVPELAKAAPAELRHAGCDVDYLWFTGVDRSCEIDFYGRVEFPHAAFYWDECELFRFQAVDRGRLAAVLKRWLCERAMPSALRIEFPEIEIGAFADYFERGKPIEGEFVKSWDSIERFYDAVGFSFISKVRAMIAQMRQKGYDTSLRAGQSLSSLIVSRSRRHGLREGQPTIAFAFGKNGMEVYSHLDEQKKMTCAEIELTPEIEDLLKALEAKSID